MILAFILYVSVVEEAYEEEEEEGLCGGRGGIREIKAWRSSST